MAGLRKVLGFGVIGLSIAMLAGPCQAASKPAPPTRPELASALSACRAIADPTERLACFDKAAAALDEAQTKGDVVVVDRQQAREVKRQAFGFRLDALSIFDRGTAKDTGDEALIAVVKNAFQNATGKWVVTLDSGAVWRQIDDDPLSREPRPGMPIRIRRATLGSYMMNVDGQPGIRVHRDE